MSITDNHLNILCCTKCRSPLHSDSVKGGNKEPSLRLKCVNCGKEYGFRLECPDFLGGRELQHPGRWIKFIRSVYSKVYTPVTNLMFTLCGGADSARREVIDRLDIKPGARVLETGIGAGDNLPYLYEMHEPGEYFGMDIQQQMIKLFRKNLEKWKLEANICHADAELLPYRDESFDSVFHLGAINLFSDKKKAIDEMIRVARPGTKIVIADESEKANRLLKLVMGKQGEVIPPVDLVPSEMENIRLHDIWKGYGYLIEFRKPG
jgi:ubiquinone/menaquinone biosynthesis C-methylase UbiE/uncharacterized protein YbaR (Trm112 family)